MIRLAKTSFAAANLFALSFVAHAQTYAGPDPDLLQAQVQGMELVASGWDQLANWQLGFVIAVAVLGGLVAGLQKFEGKKWCSVSVVAAGFLISLITVVAKEAFDGDHRAYRKLASTAREEILQAEINLAIIRSASTLVEDKHSAATEVIARISRIGRLSTSIGDGVRPSNVAGLGVIGSAHAQAQATWTSQPRTETATAIRFVGTGTGDSLAQAQTRSLEDAQRLAAAELRIPLESVVRYGRPINTSTEFDAPRGKYSHYTLFEVNKAIAPR